LVFWGIHPLWIAVHLAQLWVVPLDGVRPVLVLSLLVQFKTTDHCGYGDEAILDKLAMPPQLHHS
jgi:hypothetical protein